MSLLPLNLEAEVGGVELAGSLMAGMATVTMTTAVQTNRICEKEDAKLEFCFAAQTGADK